MSCMQQQQQHRTAHNTENNAKGVEAALLKLCFSAVCLNKWWTRYRSWSAAVSLPHPQLAVTLFNLHVVGGRREMSVWQSWRRRRRLQNYDVQTWMAEDRRRTRAFDFQVLWRKEIHARLPIKCNKDVYVHTTRHFSFWCRKTIHSALLNCKPSLFLHFPLPLFLFLRILDSRLL